jgi:hypothetical protein
MARKKSENSGLPTAYEHVLYLLFELERAIDRGGIDWSTVDADLVQGPARADCREGGSSIGPGQRCAGSLIWINYDRGLGG